MGYSLKDGMFAIENFDRQPPFSSFLPGVCGADGVPAWAFYVNRGQGIASFGVDDKNHAVMEFSPAVIAYEDTARKGFRTFLQSNLQTWEPFEQDNNCIRNMYISPNSVLLTETDNVHNICTEVKYFMLPGEDTAALIRKVRIRNSGPDTKNLEILDGMSRILPYGILNSEFKEMANLLKSYGKVTFDDKNIAYFSVNASTENNERVEITKGSYYFLTSCNHTLIRPVCDPAAVFGQDTSLGFPRRFAGKTAGETAAGLQYTENKIPCAFTPVSVSLLAGESIEFYTMIGFCRDSGIIDSLYHKLLDSRWFLQKEREAEILAQQITAPMKIHTAFPIFDAYAEQNWLDNVLRGGMPSVYTGGGKNHILHLFSRRHGDLERDYNFFRTPAVHYSEGDGNFRDVCQNRRSEVLFFPEIGDSDILYFVNLIGVDGYNALELRPDLYMAAPGEKDDLPLLMEEVLADKKRSDEVIRRIEKGFMIGDLLSDLQQLGVRLTCTEDDFLRRLLPLCKEDCRAVWNEGNWTDHWTYVPDLIDAYQKIYPDYMQQLLFSPSACRFFQTGAYVRPRKDKTCCVNGKVRQYGAVEQPKGETGQWIKDENGVTVTLSLYAKLIHLAAVKCASLDPLQLGVAMEAGKPGWNDALNGLPGIFGSSTSETIDILLLLDRLLNWSACMPGQIEMPARTDDFAMQLHTLTDQKQNGEISAFQFWNESSSLLEELREDTRIWMKGGMRIVADTEIRRRLMSMRALISESVMSAGALASPAPTYLYFRAETYEQNYDESGCPVIGPDGLPTVTVTSWCAHVLPVFLETPVKRMRLENGETAKELYRLIRESALYDSKLQMYKISGPLASCPEEAGRIRAFTPGWFENESIFLHMEYKYFLALLQAGLYDACFADMRTALVPFLDPAVYGRSTLENCSFIASGANPDVTTHGKGYIARLSGSSAEFISILLLMLIGKTMFTQENELLFTLDPILPGWLFDDNGEIVFHYLACTFCYHNPEKRNTYGENRANIVRMLVDGKSYAGSNMMRQPGMAKQLRDRELKRIDVYFI